MMNCCKHCGRKFNSSELDRCPDCGTKVGRVNPEKLEASRVAGPSEKNCRECIEKYGKDKQILWYCPEGKTVETCEKAKEISK